MNASVNMIATRPLASRPVVKTSRTPVAARPAQAPRALPPLMDITQMGDTTSSSYGSFVELSRWANPEALKEFGGGEPWVVALVCTTAAALFIVPMIYFFVGELFTDAVYEERVGGANRLPKEVRDKRAREAAKAAKQA